MVQEPELWDFESMLESIFTQVSVLIGRNGGIISDCDTDYNEDGRENH